MATAGPNYPGTGASLANAGTSENANAWTNPGNVGSSSAVASITAATFDSPDISEILVASNFGFSIPTGSTIQGITVEINKRGYTTTNSGKDYRVQLSTSTAFSGLVGSNKASASVWPSTLTTTTYGGTADTWSAGLTATQINSSSFAVFVSAYANVANADIDVDWIRVTVTYLEAFTVTLGLIDASPAIYGLTVIPDQLVSLGLIDNTVADYEATILSDSPSAVFPLDEASGNIADLVGSLSGTASGSPTYGVTGPVTGHTAVDFAAATDYFSVGDDAALDLGNGPFTLEAWFARDEDTNDQQSFIWKGATSYVLGLAGPSVGSGEHYQLGKAATTTIGYGSDYSVAVDSAWHHVVITRSGTGGSSTHKIYVDGVEKTWTAYTGGDTAELLDTTAALVIGQENASNRVGGKLAYIALYKSVLSSTRVTAHYDARNATGGGAGVYALSVVRLDPPAGDQDLTLGLIDGASAIYGLTLTPKNTLTVGAIESTSAIYGLTVVKAPYPITLGAIESTPAIYNITATPKNTLTLGLIDAGSAIYGVTVATKNTLILGLIDAAPAIYSLGLGTTVALGLIQTGSSGTVTKTWDFTSDPGWSSAVGEEVWSSSGGNPGGYEYFARNSANSDGVREAYLTTTWEALGAPVGSTITRVRLLTVDRRGVLTGFNGTGGELYLRDGSSTLLATLATEVANDNTWHTYAPATWNNITDQSSSATVSICFEADAYYEIGESVFTLSWDNLSIEIEYDGPYGSLSYPLTLTKAPYPITLGLIDASPAIYALTVVRLGGIQTVELGLIDAGSAIYSLTVIPDQFLTLGVIESTSAIYSITVVKAPYPVTLAAIESTPAVYGITVVKAPYPVTLGFIDAGSAIYGITVVKAPYPVTLGFIDSGAAIYNLTVIPDQFISPALIDSGSAIYALTVVRMDASPQGITLGLIDAVSAIYSLTVAHVQVVALGLIVSGGESFSNEVALTGPVARWRLGEASGNPQDSVGTAHVTTVSGSPVYGVAGALGGDPDTSINISSSGTRMVVPHQSVLDLGDGPWSIEFWYRRDTDTGVLQTILSKAADGYLIQVRNAPDVMALDKVGMSGYITASTAAIDNGNWHHWFVTRSGSGAGNTLWYRDAVEGHADSLPASTYGSTTGDLTIGDEGTLNLQAYGGLDEIALYDFVVSPTRIAAHYDARNGTGGAVVYALSVSGAAVVELGLIDSGSAIYDLSVSAATPPAQDIGLSVIGSVGSEWIDGEWVDEGLADAGVAVYPLTVENAFSGTVTLGAIISVSTVYDITVTYIERTQSVALPLVGTTPAVYSIQVSLYGVVASVTLGLVVSLPVVYSVRLRRGKRNLEEMYAMWGLGTLEPRAKPREYRRL